MEDPVAEQTPASDKCARCLQLVSSKAARCPHCGQPVNNPRRLVFMVVATAGALALLFMLVVMYRTVYLADLQTTTPIEDDQPPPAPFAEATSTSQDVPAPPKAETAAKPAEPDRPPPLNR